MALQLFHYNFWPAAQAARISLLELGQAHTLTNVDMAAGEHQSPNFKTLNPTGKPPVLVDTEGPDPSHNLVTWGSAGVIAYLDARRVRLNLPGESQIPPPPCIYPKTFQWAEWVAVNVTEPMSTVLLHTKIMPSADRKRAIFRAAVQTLRAAVDTIETAVPEPGQFLNRDIEHPTPDGGKFSFADILFASSLSYARLFPAGDRVLENHPRTDAFLASIEARPSFQQAFKGVTIPPPPTEPLQPPP